MDKEEFLRRLNQEGILIHGTTWEYCFKRLQELKNYKEMWEEIEKIDDATEWEMLSLEDIKRKYFPIKKIITIEINEVTEANLDAINERIKMFINKRFYIYEGDLGKIHIKETE